MKNFGRHLVILLLVALCVFSTSVVFANNGSDDDNGNNGNNNANFSIDNITVNCDGTGQVFFTGTIPNGGFTLELMDKDPSNSGPFIETVPPTIITITSGTSPISYSISLANWSGPHLRVDSDFNTKSDSLNCPVTTPTATPTPSVTPSVTPSPTTDPCVGDNATSSACLTPTATPSATPTQEPTPTPTPGSGCTDNCGGGSSNNSSNNSSSSSSNSSSPSQAVLGASTMATTGTFEENLMNSLIVLGMIVLSLGGLSYAKEKSK